jgi:conjugative relaxase-like TrwC/TraI family protein
VETGAATLGLEGEADGEAFGALIAGRDPSSEEVLRAGSGRDRVCALDLTFSAPKSVSVLFAIGDPETSRAWSTRTRRQWTRRSAISSARRAASGVAVAAVSSWRRMGS